MKKETKKKLTAAEFDSSFDKGGVSEYLDKSTARVSSPMQRINIDIPQGILQKVDREAERMGIPRTSLIKIWIAEHTDRLAG